MRKTYILLFLTLLMCVNASGKGLVGRHFDFNYKDAQFKNPYIDIDKTMKSPAVCRYIHGGFDDGTKFSFYFPLKKSEFTNRFFQYITPFPDSETSAQAYPAELSPIAFSVSHGAYFIETNEGGRLDFNDPSTKREATIGAYRANAACADFSRVVAKAIYGSSRQNSPSPTGEGRDGAHIFGYCYGGSGGAYRTTGAIESTEGVWDGAVPYVLGSPMAIPNTFAVRMNALRVLKDKMADIVDAMEPGGSGDPYATLNVEQRQVLREATAMGFPIKSWYGWKYMDAHGFLVLYRGIVAADPTYFHQDFWNKPGYLGFDNPPSLARDHVQTKSVVKRIIGQTEAEKLGLVAPLSAADRGSADRAWASMGSEIKEKPIAYEIDREVVMNTLGGELMMLNGEGKGQQLQVVSTKGKYVVIAAINNPKLLTKLHVGDSVQVDNSDWLASETYYRHQVPTRDYYVWNQFRSFNGEPIYPQRPQLLGPGITESAAGCLPSGKIHAKMILCCSAWDREAFPWQGDWYRNKVKEHLGKATDDNFRLWYTDHAIHGGMDDPTEVVMYEPILYQALLDVSDWVERGIAPSHTSDYNIVDGQVIFGKDGSNRGGIQPVPYATVNGKERAEVKPGEPVTIHVSVDVPKGMGKVVKADWCLDYKAKSTTTAFIEDSKVFTLPVDLSKATYSNDGEHMEFDTTISYDKPGTYFPTVKVFSERHGDASTTFTRISNLGKVRIIVK